MSVHLLDIEWLLSTLFDASLFKLSKPPATAALFLALPDKAGGMTCRPIMVNADAFCRASVLCRPSSVLRSRVAAATMSESSSDLRFTGCRPPRKVAVARQGLAQDQEQTKQQQ
jgi:hypothetical protein